jgi:uncharacterized protein YecT (DUF1311 family)
VRELLKLRWLLRGAAGAILSLMLAGVFGMPASAQSEPDVDCDNQNTQLDMNICAAQEYDEADAALNEQYNKTRRVLAEGDKELSDGETSAAKALLTAQRAWINYRDAHCEAVGFQARGGSMQPMLVSGCLAELTRTRTEELSTLADGIGN